MRILFIGAINKSGAPTGGEEYKNTVLLNKFKSFPHIELIIIDTKNWKNNLLIIFRILYYLFIYSFDKIILSSSTLSVNKLLKFISLFRNKLLPKIIYFVVGGWFPKAINDKFINEKYYFKIDSIIVQGKIIEEQLSKTQLKNIKVIPNFKEFANNLKIKSKDESIFKFVFIGRISKTKGILEIIEAARLLKTQNLVSNFSVDFYGPKEEDIEFPNNSPLFYRGFLDIMNNQQESYLTLSKYSCMLFPTYWKGEGFPGVIIDAYIAGLPVIATDWNMNKEVVTDGETGLIVPLQDANALALAMLKMMQDPELVKKMSKNSLNKAKDFHIDNVWPQIEKLLI